MVVEEVLMLDNFVIKCLTLGFAIFHRIDLGCEIFLSDDGSIGVNRIDFKNLGRDVFIKGDLLSLRGVRVVMIYSSDPDCRT